MSLEDIALTSYISKVKKIPILEDNEEYVLAKRWRENHDKKALDKLISSHLRLVVKIAKGYGGYGLSQSDLIAEGNIGIMHAIQHYDPSIGYKFSTYALWWIKSKMQEYIYNSWSIVKWSGAKDQKKLFFGLQKIKRFLGISDVTEENAAKIAEALNVKEESVITAETRFSSRDFSTNTNLEENSGSTWEDFLADERENIQHELAEKQEYAYRKKILHEALNTLTKREYNIVCNYRLRVPPQTLQQIGKEENLSAERVRQIEKKAFLKIQRYVHRVEWDTQQGASQKYATGSFIVIYVLNETIINI